MATKTTKKTVNKAKPAATRKKAPAKKSASPKSSPKRTAKTGGKARASKSAPATKKIRQPRSPRPIRQGMSLDRKLDILGMALTLLGVLTLLSLLSPIKSILTQQWVQALKSAFGSGIFVFPFTLILCGLWLILRNFERIPQFAVERVLGLILLFSNFLASIHFITTLRTQANSFELAAAGMGGGYSGALIIKGLETALGTGGAAIALVAWLIIALVLSMDMTILEMARRITPVWYQFIDWAADRSAEMYAKRRRKTMTPGSDYSDLVPVTGEAAQQHALAIASAEDKNALQTGSEMGGQFVPNYAASDPCLSGLYHPLSRSLTKVLIRLMTMNWIESELNSLKKP